MARLESVKVAGYYPAPTALLSSFASTFTWPSPEPEKDRWRRILLLDPCAGDGEAIVTMADTWRERYPHLRFEVIANEMEGERGRALARRLSRRDRALTADAFCLGWKSGSVGVALGWINPPYNHDPRMGRLEHRWLVRFTESLHAGAGYLMFLVPAHAVGCSAEYLATRYVDLRCFRLPQPHFERFKQVLVIGRRSPSVLPESRMTETVQRWSAEPEALPVLEPRCRWPISVVLAEEYGLHLEERRLDVMGALAEFRPWRDAPVGVERDPDELIGVSVRTALPPKPAHVAMALASGHFNGHELAPNDPERHPAILAKGVFGRELVEVSERVGADGEVTGTVEIEQPKLEVSILRLDTYTYHDLSPGTEPTGASDPARWNVADLVVGYDRSLAERLKHQFPPIHDPSSPAHEMALPSLARKPYRVQRDGIQASLKLLALGQNPILASEVGTGKSTVALYTVASLMEPHRARTLAELRRLGFPTRLRTVRRVLILCPPHLLESWTDQIGAVLPGASVLVAQRLGDLEKEANFYLLSRETAKLGHGVRGISGRCPGCGARVRTDARTNASRRARCGAIRRTPANECARLAVKLACALARTRAPDAEKDAEDGDDDEDPRVQVLLPPIFDRIPEDAVREVNRAIAADVLMDGVRLACAHPPGGRWALEQAVKSLARALGAGNEVAAVAEAAGLRDLAHGLRERPTSDDPMDDLLRALETLGTTLGAWRESGPCGGPLYQAIPEPRRFPLARYIVSRHRRRWDACIVDEGHEYHNQGSAQSKAAQRLMGLPGVPTLFLSGSLSDGYCSCLFISMWALSPEFRSEFERSEKQSFAARYGYRKVLITINDDDRRLGSRTDRELKENVKVIGEAPGISPAFVLRHLLPTAVVIHKSDLDQELPPMTELPVPLEPEDDRDRELVSEYERLEELLLDRIGRDRFEAELSGRLLGALLELPSYLDRSTEDCGPFRIAYPESCGGEVLATAKLFPAGWLPPKERYLVRTLKAQIAAGERVLVFVRHTGTALPKRLVDLVKTHVTRKVTFLDAKKVPAGKREAWIRRHVLDTGVEVMISNANCLRTGLNVLVAFSTAIWFELEWSTYCYRQANGRLHRIGQSRPVSILLPHYAGTAQEAALDLVARKLTAAVQLDGLDVRAALESAGASEDRATALATAMSIGEQVLKRMLAMRAS